MEIVKVLQRFRREQPQEEEIVSQYVTERDLDNILEIKNTFDEAQQMKFQPYSSRLPTLDELERSCEGKYQAHLGIWRKQ